MKGRALVLAGALLLGACARVTEENFARIRDAMSEEEVRAVLGAATDSASVSVFGVSGTSSRWVGDGAVITVQFVNGKVRLKSFERPAAAK
ncbi:MAG: hypothetical protein AB1773_00945 [Pseudomonadota bacterium]